MILLGSLWLALCQHLRVEWTINPQYSYGWGVPWLALYLFWKRWLDRPNPDPASFGPLSLGVAALLLVSLLPLRLLLEANPDWRLVSWLATATVVGLSLTLVQRAGGWPWLRHFWLPIAFILLAVPWPTPLEQGLIQALMRGVAGVTVEILNWSGIPARQLGNLIQLPSGTVGVDEACSGVRSLQSTLMAAVFLGEMYRFGAARRLQLVLAGLGLALIFNVGRTFLLTWTMLRRGEAGLEAVHDPAGYIVLFLAFIALWCICVVLQKRSTATLPPHAPLPPVPAPAEAPSPRWLSGPMLIGVTAWFAFVAIGNEAWYRWHERSVGRNLAWSVEWPADGDGFQAQPISEEVRTALRYDSGQAGLHLHDDGSQALVFFFRWRPGRASAQSARSHSPEICLPSGGLRPAGPVGRFVVSKEALQIAFRTYVYEGAGRTWHVFYTLWEDRPATASLHPEDLSRASRFRAVLEGRRHLGQQVLEIAITGVHDAEAARRRVDRYIERWLRLAGPPP